MKREISIKNDKATFTLSLNGSDQADRLLNYSEEDLEKLKFYEDFYVSSEENINHLRKTRISQFNVICTEIKNILSKAPSDSSLIDVGAARGEFVEYLQDHFKAFRTYGIEPALKESTESLKKLKLEEIVGQSEIPHEYQMVFLMDVFEHFEDSKETIKILSSLVKKDGYICLKVPNKDSLLYRLTKVLSFVFKKLSSKLFWRMYQVDYPPPHFYYYNKASLQDVISEQFTLEKSFYVSELPMNGLYDRLWGLNPLFKVFILPIAFVYNLVTIGSLKDGLVIVAQKK